MCVNGIESNGSFPSTTPVSVIVIWPSKTAERSPFLSTDVTKTRSFPVRFTVVAPLNTIFLLFVRPEKVSAQLHQYRCH